MGGDELPGERELLLASAVGEAAELADAHEALGQDVQEESPDDLDAIEAMERVRLPAARSFHRKQTRPSSIPNRRAFDIATRWV
jgi:hypothetical protein